MIVIGGEALVDLVPDPNAPAGELGPLLPRLGGGPFNVAIALGRLGVPTSFLARLSTDQFGAAQLDRLRKSEVDERLVQRDERPTTLAVVELGEDGSARYGFHVAETAARHVTDPGALPNGTTALCLGTLGMVLEPGASAYESVLFREAERGRFVALDPNIRADLIEDADAYRRRFTSWLPAVDLLKLSVDDACWLAGVEDPDDPALLDAVRGWHRDGTSGRADLPAGKGASAIVVTKGGDGLSAVIPGGELVEVPGVPVRVADTIGAGDTVQAALVAWLYDHGALSAEGIAALNERGWAIALRYAASAAAVTVSRAGAEPPTAAELDLA